MLLSWALIFAAVLLIGLSKAGFMSGAGLLITPMIAIGLAGTGIEGGEKVALGLALPLLIFGDCFATWQYRKDWIAKHVRLLIIPAIWGVLLGGAILWIIELTAKDHARLAGLLLRLEIGLESVILVGLHYWRQLRGLPQQLLPEKTRAFLSGSFAGLTSTLAHAAGPVVALYLLPLKIDRRQYVGTVAFFFLFLNLMKVPAFVLAGQFSRTPLWLLLCLLPVVALGAIVGKILVKRMTNASFVTLTYGLTFVLGLYLLIDATVGLIGLARN